MKYTTKIKNEHKLGFTAGQFDLLHPGYIYMFQKVKYHCDEFYVFLQDDPSVDRPNKYPPVVPAYERYNALMSLKYVDDVYMYQTEQQLLELIEFWKPSVRILSEDYIGKTFTGDHLPIEVIYTTRTHGWSNTELKNKITRQTIKRNPDIIQKEMIKTHTEAYDKGYKAGANQKDNRPCVCGFWGEKK